MPAVDVKDADGSAETETVNLQNNEMKDYEDVPSSFDVFFVSLIAVSVVSFRGHFHYCL